MLSRIFFLPKETPQISALVRSKEARDAVLALVATPIHFDGLQDLDVIKDAASRHDGTFSHDRSHMHHHSLITRLMSSGHQLRFSYGPRIVCSTSGGTRSS